MESIKPNFLNQNHIGFNGPSCFDLENNVYFLRGGISFEPVCRYNVITRDWKEILNKHDIEKFCGSYASVYNIMMSHKRKFLILLGYIKQQVSILLVDLNGKILSVKKFPIFQSSERQDPVSQVDYIDELNTIYLTYYDIKCDRAKLLIYNFDNKMHENHFCDYHTAFYYHGGFITEKSIYSPFEIASMYCEFNTKNLLFRLKYFTGKGQIYFDRYLVATNGESIVIYDINKAKAKAKEKENMRWRGISFPDKEVDCHCVHGWEKNYCINPLTGDLYITTQWRIYIVKKVVPTPFNYNVIKKMIILTRLIRPNNPIKLSDRNAILNVLGSSLGINMISSIIGFASDRTTLGRIRNFYSGLIEKLD